MAEAEDAKDIEHVMSVVGEGEWVDDGVEVHDQKHGREDESGYQRARRVCPEEGAWRADEFKKTR